MCMLWNSGIIVNLWLILRIEIYICETDHRTRNLFDAPN